MVEYIKNDKLSVKVKSLGAELTSFKTLEDNIELLWQGDHKYWSGQSPILFPIIGKIPNDTYEFEGKNYNLQGHGFAYKSKFELVDKSESSLCYRLKKTDITKKVYPFDFELYVTYSLQVEILTVGFEVRNIDSKAMFFSIGGHPAFKCPIFEDENMEDYYLEFEKKENVERIFLGKNLLTGETQKFLVNENRIDLSHKLFYKGAIILQGLESEWVELKNNKNNRKVRCRIKDFPYLGIWSAINDGPYVCIEPWQGISSKEGESHKLTKKTGIIKLDAGKIFKVNYTIEALG